MIILLISLIIYTIPVLIIFWKLYKIAGKPGWMAIVPVYSTVVMAKIANKSVIVGAIGGLFEVFVYLRMAVDNPILGISRVITVFFALYVLNAFIKQYNRGLGYWALVVFLPWIAVFITDKSQYIGSNKGTVNNPKPVDGHSELTQANFSAMPVTAPTQPNVTVTEPFPNSAQQNNQPPVQPVVSSLPITPSAQQVVTPNASSPPNFVQPNQTVIQPTAPSSSNVQGSINQEPVNPPPTQV